MRIQYETRGLLVFGNEGGDGTDPFCLTASYFIDKAFGYAMGAASHLAHANC